MLSRLHGAEAVLIVGNEATNRQRSRSSLEGFLFQRGFNSVDVYQDTEREKLKLLALQRILDNEKGFVEVKRVQEFNSSPSDTCLLRDVCR